MGNRKLKPVSENNVVDPSTALRMSTRTRSGGKAASSGASDSSRVNARILARAHRVPAKKKTSSSIPQTKLASTKDSKVVKSFVIYRPKSSRAKSKTATVVKLALRSQQGAGTAKKMQIKSKLKNKKISISKKALASAQDSKNLPASSQNGRKRKQPETKSSPPSKRSRKGELSPKPFVTNYSSDPTFEQTLPMPFISPTFQSKLLIRAILVNDMKLLQKLTHEKKSISSFCIPRSITIDRDALSFAIQTGNVAAIKILMPKILAEKFAPPVQWLIQKETTGGRGSKMMFGHALRTVTMGRGGKEGNAALLKDGNIFDCPTASQSFSVNQIQEALSYGLPFTTLEQIKGIHKKNEDCITTIFLSNIFIAVRNGHNQLASQLIESAVTKGGFGFNTLHQEALIKSKRAPLSPFKSQSVGKKTIGNSRITPLHCAAINPDTYCLSTLLSSSPLYTVVDTDNWTLAHYAAACTGSGPLEYLICRGISTNQINKQGSTPAHIAAQYGRWKNLELILKAESKAILEIGEDEEEPNEKISQDAYSVTRMNKNGRTPLHEACVSGELEAVKTLLTSPLVDINKPIPAHFDKLTPLMLAAGYGHLSVMKHLIGVGVKLHIGDRRGNTALTHAVMNGHAHIVSYLLRIGDNHLSKDSSGNTLLHYACAYGWYFNMMLLLEAGCCPNEPNQWKLTPLAIAFMKGHMGLVEILLKQPGVDINASIDSKGSTLLLETCSSEPSQEVITRLKYLVEEQKVDCQVSDYEQNTAVRHLRVPTVCTNTCKSLEKRNENMRWVHYLVESETNALQKIQERKEQGWDEKRKKDCTLVALKLLLKNGANIHARNSAEDTPISIAVNHGCFQLVQQLLDLGGVLSPEPNSAGDTLLHLLIEHLTEQETVVSEFYKNCAKDPKSLAAMKSMALAYNKLGMTPLLQTLKQYGTVKSAEHVKKITEFILFLVITLNSDVDAVMTDTDQPTAPGNSVLHLAVGLNYSEDILRILLVKKPNLDPVNKDFRTPLALSIVKRNHTAIKMLLENGAEVNFKSTKDGDKTMILLEASQTPNSFNLIPLFIEKGAVVKEIVDKNNGNSILHFISKNPGASCAVAAINAVLKAGVVITYENKYFRTSLHLAVNSRGGETDISYDVEDTLIEAGANLARRDIKGRTPLHFAFLKIGKASKQGVSNSFMDPIELVTLLTSAMKERKLHAEIETLDEFGQTPLHLAAIRGATISASHLLAESKNAKELLNLTDKNGNTPFALAVLNGHEGCALMLLQAGANFVMNLTNGFSKALPDGTVASSWIWKPVEFEAEWMDRQNTEESVYSILQEIVRKDWQGLLYLMLEKLKTDGSGVAPGIQAAIKTKRLKLGAKLIDRVKINQQLITKKESLLHTLARCSSPGEGDDAVLQSRILHTLVKKNADVNSVDSQQSIPLIYAAMKWNAHLCYEFTQLMNMRQIPHLKPDFVGRTPFSVLFWEPIHHNAEIPEKLKSWAESLLFSGADGNILCQYPIGESSYPGVRFIRREAGESNYYMTSITTHYSPLIMAIIYGNKAMVKWLLSLEGKIDINFPDSRGRTPLMHATRLNDLQMIKLLFNPKSYDVKKDKRPWAVKTLTGKNASSGGVRKLKSVLAGKNSPCISSGINLNVVDKEGWSAIHHLVSPFNPSSTSFIYARADILVKLLVENGAKLDIKTEGPFEETPLDMSLRLKKFPLAKYLASLLGTNMKTVAVEYEAFPIINDTISTIPIEAAQKNSNEMLEQLKSALVGDNEEAVTEPDSLTDYTTEDSIVLIDEGRQVPFDCLLTKADFSYGLFGLYNFYKMQIIKQTKGPGLIILFTRWGRMGDEGQFQKTPFSTEAEAMVEFRKIFRSKTGNVWDELNTTAFVALPKKYKLVNLDRGKLSNVNPKFADTVKINYEDLERAASFRDTKLNSDVVDLVRILSLEHRSRKLNLSDDTNMLPFGQLEYKTLEQAEQILDQIDTLLVKESQSKNKSSTAQLGELILTLSEEYFTLIPVHGYAFEKITPFTQLPELRKQQELIRNFLHNEFAFQLLLAAQWNQGRVNPFEYVYATLGTKIQILDKSSEESQFILQSIYNTTDPQERPIVEKIYRVDIPGAEHRMTQTGIGNRQLLWHGTQTRNLLSILHHGLQIAPLGYTYNGSLFGKGIYFADMFAKSIKYAGTIKSGKSRFALLCEVALGQIQDVEMGWMSQNEGLLNPLNNSLKTSNSRYVPEPSSDVFWKGRRVLLGPKSKNILPDDNNEGHGLDYNEYIIFVPEQANIKYLVQFQGIFPNIKLNNLSI